jgi:hypothetical protein
MLPRSIVPLREDFRGARSRFERIRADDRANFVGFHQLLERVPVE